MGDWTFLTNHAHVLNYIAKHQNCTGREMAMALRVTERTIQNVIGDLEAEGYVTRRRVGRRNVYTVRVEKRMRHPTQRNVTVGDLLQVLAPVANLSSPSPGPDPTGQPPG